jgi:hypothetical protein
MWKEEPSAEITLLYRETLKDIPPDLLHKAWIRAAKTSKFRPTPAEIREAAQIEADLARRGNRPRYLDEPKLTIEEREAELNDPSYLEFRKRFVRS